MTPLIDVMLVLLVIFMVTAPLMASSLKLQLPASDAATPPSAAPFLAVSIDAAGTLRLGDEPIAAAQLAERFAAAAVRDARTEVHLRADRSIAYGRVAELIGLAQKAGLTRIGFVTDPAALGGEAAPPSR